MDVNGGGFNGPVPQECLDSEQISPIFVKMCAESVTERMAGEPLRPAEAPLMGMDMPGEEKGIDGRVNAGLFREKPAPGASISKPVLCKEEEGSLREDGKAVLASFGLSDVDTHMCAVNILITEAADFTDTQAGGIHKSGHGLLLEVGHGRDKTPDFILGRDKGEMGIKPAERELGRVPGFMKDIDGKETQLRDTVIKGTVRKMALLLDKTDKRAQIVP